MTERGDKAKMAVLSRDLEILNQYGIHARPAALIVRTASRFDSEVFIEKDGNRVSGKSIMGLMTLEASHGSRVRITAEGHDAEEVIEELQKLFHSKFDED